MSVQEEAAIDRAKPTMSVGRYLATRLPTLKPPMDHTIAPWTAFRMLNKRQWNSFLVSLVELKTYMHEAK